MWLEKTAWQLLALLHGWLSRLPHTGDLGRRGEQVAARFLMRRGYLIVERRSRDRGGEADLIAYHRDSLVFVEVKTRSSTRYGRPGDAVDRKKQTRLIRYAHRHCRRFQLRAVRIRFDVIAVTWPNLRRPPKIEHFKAAFRAPPQIGCDPGR